MLQHTNPSPGVNNSLSEFSRHNSKTTRMELRSCSSEVAIHNTYYILFLRALNELSAGVSLAVTAIFLARFTPNAVHNIPKCVLRVGGPSIVHNKITRNRGICKYTETQCGFRRRRRWLWRSVARVPSNLKYRPVRVIRFSDR